MNSHRRQGALAALAGLTILLSACSGTASSPSAAPATAAPATAAPATAAPATAAPATAAPTAAPSVAMTTVRFTFDWKPDSDWLPMLEAVQQGYFKAGNIDVKFVEGNGSSDALPLIGTGAQDIGQISGPPLIQGVQQQIPVTAVGVMLSSSPNVILCDGAKIKTPKDLEKGYIFGDQAGEFEHALWVAWSKKLNLDLTKVKVVPVTGESDQEFIQGQIDCYIDFYTSGAIVAETEGRPGEETLFPIKDTLDVYGHTMVVNNDFLAKNPDAVKAFVLAYAKGIQYTIQHRDEAVALLLSQHPEMNNKDGKAALEWSSKRYTEGWASDVAKASGILSFTDAGWTATKATIVDGGLSNGKDIDISKLYTNKYLPNPPVTP